MYILNIKFWGNSKKFIKKNKSKILKIGLFLDIDFPNRKIEILMLNFIVEKYLKELKKELFFNFNTIFSSNFGKNS